MKLFKFCSLFAFFLLTLTSCIRPTESPKSAVSESSEDRNFKTLEVTGFSSEAPAETNSSWKIPKARIYNFKACLISLKTPTPLAKGQEFKIVSPDQSFQKEKTDENGCLSWKEVTYFPFSSRSQYILKERTLKTSGIYQGQQTIILAVNPWSPYRNEGDSPEIVDTRFYKLPDTLTIKEKNLQEHHSAQAASQHQQLYLEQPPKVHLIKTSEKNDLKIIVRTKPYLNPINRHGLPVKYPLRSGTYEVFVQFYASYLGQSADQSMILIPGLLPQKVTINKDGVLSFEIDSQLKRIANSGQVQMGLKIKPLGASTPIKSYEGLHNLGIIKNFYNGKEAVQVAGPQSQSPFSYGEFFEKSKNKFKDLKKQRIARDLKPFKVEELEPRFIRVQSGETATQRTVFYRVTTRIVSPLSDLPLEEQAFTILRKGKEPEVIYTNESGVLKWTDTIHHYYYHKEQYRFPEVTLIHHLSQSQQKLKMAINPWDEGWTFGADARGNEKFYRDMNREEVRNPTLMVDAFRYQTIRFRYEIDKYLTLNVKKAVNMAMDPLVQRFSILHGRKFEPLRDGIYLVKLALVKYYIDPFSNGSVFYKDNSTNPPSYKVDFVGKNEDFRKGSFTTVIKKLLRVQAGRITTPLEFSMRDLRMMSIRANIMVQLQTIDERSLMTLNLKMKKAKEFFKQKEEYLELKTDEEKEAFLENSYLKAKEGLEDLNTGLQYEFTELDLIRNEYSDISKERHKEIDKLKKSLKISKEEYMSSLKSKIESQPHISNVHELPEGVLKQELERIEKDNKKRWSVFADKYREKIVRIQDSLKEIPDEHAVAEKRYADYLRFTDIFLKENSLIHGSLSRSDLKELKLNNYTENPAAPYIDLDLLVEDSGLPSRTFIGPCTLVEDDNMSEMRPTDTIDEKFCDKIDCKEVFNIKGKVEIENKEIERSRYHDSMFDFSSTMVDDFVTVHKKNELNYQQKMLAFSSIGHFTKGNGLTYVSLTNKKPKSFINGCQFKKEDLPGPHCFEETSAPSLTFQNFFESMKESFNKPGDFSFSQRTEEKDHDEKSKEDDSRPYVRPLLDEYFYYFSLKELSDREQKVYRDNSLQPLLKKAKREGKKLLYELEKETKTFWQKHVSPLLESSVESERTKKNDTEKYLEKTKFVDYSTELNKSYFHNLIENGTKNIRLPEAIGLCRHLSDKTVNIWIQDKKLFPTEQRTDLFHRFYYYCLSQIQYLPAQDQVFLSGLSLDRRLKILEVGHYKHIDGKNMNINVGMNFSLSNYSDLGTTHSLGVNYSGLLGAVGDGVGLIPWVGKVGEWALKSAGNIITASSGVSKTKGLALDNSSAVDFATFLVVQKAEIELELKKYEKCLIVGFNKSFFREMTYETLGLSPKEVPLDHFRQLKVPYTGYFMCDGNPQENKPTVINENFYYITQHFTAGDMLDIANLLNHVWLFSIRGANDFRTFVETIKAKEIDSDGKEIGEIKISDYPLSKLKHIYSKLYPSFPGLYSVPESFTFSERRLLEQVSTDP